MTFGRPQKHGREWTASGRPPVLGVHMQKTEPDLSGDYGYDLAHDVPRGAQAAVHRGPARPGSGSTAGRWGRLGSVSPTTGLRDRGWDHQYDEAHDF